ncbi:hypothetical protein [Segetibacter aerophilus]|nr:hypothetical protein [Segetibacter aerophilus]
MENKVLFDLKYHHCVMDRAVETSADVQACDARNDEGRFGDGYKKLFY